MKKSLGARTLSFPLPAFLVGSYDEEGRANLMTAAWGGIVCSEPPCLAVAIRPSRWTFSAIVKNKAFTVSIPNSRLAAAVDYVGMFSGKDHDKFARTGLTPVKSDLVNAPYVDESPLIIECQLHNSLELGSHTLFVGCIADVKAEADLDFSRGSLDINEVDPIIYNSGGDYHKVGASLGKAYSIGMALKA
ncbi:MAG: flavin reductase family protein [Desulfarculales bacterium]|jgi:flavin reductase (DIM6/NTAB) family NADH-FMN oxidoreductase RutF|nr:flavin reductase family protein [Desulfarculales bacterium]